MTRLRVTLCLLVLSVWLAVQTPARAYEEQASIDAALGYVLVTGSDNLPRHGASLALGASYGLTETLTLRGDAAYLALIDDDDTVSGGRARVEALYLFDVLQVVPFVGLGLDVLAAEGASGSVRVRPGAHLVLGADYLVSRTWTLGFDVRSALYLERSGPMHATEIALRVGRMFETF